MGIDIKTALQFTKPPESDAIPDGWAKIPMPTFENNKGQTTNIPLH